VVLSYKSLRRILLAVTALIAFLQFWTSRHLIYWDGISYLEIAQRLTVNGYWSPLFSWLLAPAVRILPAYWHPAAMHALQAILCVTAVVLALRLFDRLFPEVEHKRGWLVTAWACAMWAACSLVGAFIVQPDMLALCLFLLSLDLLVQERWLGLGVTLGLSYLAKAAMFPFALVLLALWSFQNRRRAALALGAFLLVSGPWIAMLWRHTGHLTIGENGKLNYVWNVGEVREANWQGGPGGYGTPLHGTKQIWTKPEAFVYGSPAVEASYPLWFEPSYWYDGVRIKFDPALQLHSLVSNTTLAAWYWASAPGLLAPLVLLGRMSWRGFGSALKKHWILLTSSLSVVGLYTIVFVEQRYIAGPLLILAAIPLAEVYRRSGVPGSRIMPAAAVAMLIWLLGPMTAASLYGIASGAAAPNQNALLAQELTQRGLPRGARVVMIGPPFSAEWARIGGFRIVGDVSPRATWTKTLPRLVNMDFANLSAYWNLPKPVQDEVMDRFRKEGAEYAFATVVPDGADLGGWIPLDTSVDAYGSDPRLWFRPLESLSAAAPLR
jgi:hypothetical protein